ncbi:regulatory protein [Pleurotus ostreatus]|nr:regulatory protein [Pleurotus ostreatus]
MPTTTEVISSVNDTLAAHAALISRVRATQNEFRQQLHAFQSPPYEILKLPTIPSPTSSPGLSERFSPPPSPTLKEQQHQKQLQRTDLPPAKRARASRYRNYVPEEETIRNDYSQRYVDGGEWPQNWVLGTDPERRFEEYPKQRRLLELKKASVAQHAVSPSYLPFSELQSLGSSKFDVVLIDPPFSSSFTWDHLQELPIPLLAAEPSFIFLWVGSGAGEGLERGREVLAKWGYRRCEDVVWVKTNKTTNRGPGTDPPTTSLLTRTKQHCLIGIRGTVRRSTDSWFVHCNVDTDVIIWEGDPLDPTRKPPEMYTLIENFCLGTRRLELFGRVPTSFRRGWVTVLSPGHEDRLPTSKNDSGSIKVETEDGGTVDLTRWDKDKWEHGIQQIAEGGKAIVPTTPDIDTLRPKSPFRPGQGHQMPGGSAMGGPAAGRMIGAGNRGGFGSGVHDPGQMMGQPMMGMTNMGMATMGMVPGMGMGVGVGVGVDDMMWQGAGMGVGMGMGMNQMGVGGMGQGGGMGTGLGLGGMNMPTMMGGMGQMSQMSQMGQMGGMGMGSAFQGTGFASGFNNMNANNNMARATGGVGPGMFGGQMQGIGDWGDQNQFGMDTGWDHNDNRTGAMVPGGGTNLGVNMGNMNMNNGMGMGQWGTGGF